ncbi:helix-turn-helix domain-containing protein [Microbacterium sp. AG238]|uniref:helix-turn-helix domain-containing protein n=1 Tax=Microbacterium sp. AG238 TaxID=2183994 RepID=UPI0011C3B484|nr:helix-turn-helix domain-containing protein [Microbacterium sp. AG238]
MTVELIRDALGAQRRTQEWLAIATGIPLRTLSRKLHLTSPSPTNLEELVLIAGALDIEPAKLLEPLKEASHGHPD